MAIEQNCRLARRAQPFSVNHGVARAFHQLNFMQSGGPKFVRDELSGLQNIGFMFGRGANAGDAQKRLKSLQQGLFFGF